MVSHGRFWLPNHPLRPCTDLTNNLTFYFSIHYYQDLFTSLFCRKHLVTWLKKSSKYLKTYLCLHIPVHSSHASIGGYWPCNTIIAARRIICSKSVHLFCYTSDEIIFIALQSGKFSSVLRGLGTISAHRKPVYHSKFFPSKLLFRARMSIYIIFSLLW